MKSAATIFSVAVTTLAVGLVTVRGSGPDGGHVARIRGQESYYSGDPASSSEKVIVHLQDTEPSVSLVARIHYRFQLGLDQKDPQEHVKEARAHVRDGLIGYLSGLRSRDFHDPVRVRKVRRRLKRLVEESLFPEGDGRVREVLFTELQLQPH